MIEVEAPIDATEIDIDGKTDKDGMIRYIGSARRGFDGTWTALAIVGEALCRVEIKVRPSVHVDQDPGDAQ